MRMSQLHDSKLWGLLSWERGAFGSGVSGGKMQIKRQGRHASMTRTKQKINGEKGWDASNAYVAGKKREECEGGRLQEKQKQSAQAKRSDPRAMVRGEKGRHLKGLTPLPIESISGQGGRARLQGKN